VRKGAKNEMNDWSGGRIRTVVEKKSKFQNAIFLFFIIFFKENFRQFNFFSIFLNIFCMFLSPLSFGEGLFFSLRKLVKLF